MLKLLELTSKVIKLTRSGKAFPLYNRGKNNSLLESQAYLVGVVFFKQMQVYISGHHQVEHFSMINKQTDGEIQQLGILKYVEGWWQIADEDALTLVTGSKSKSKKAKRYEEVDLEGEPKI